MKKTIKALKNILRSSTIPKEEDVTTPEDADRHYVSMDDEFRPPYNAKQVEKTMEGECKDIFNRF